MFKKSLFAGLLFYNLLTSLMQLPSTTRLPEVAATSPAVESKPMASAADRLPDEPSNEQLNDASDEPWNEPPTPSNGKARSPKDIARLAMGSTVVIEVADVYTQNLFKGSGFVVEPGIVATNWHVVSKGTHGTVRLINQEQRYVIDGLVAADPKTDLALVRVSGLDVVPLPCGDDRNICVGDRGFAIGNPEGFEGTFSEGMISGIRKGGTELQITVPISHGSSGGPLLDTSGRVVGIVRSFYTDGQNLNFAAPVHLLKELQAQKFSPPVRLADLRYGAESMRPPAIFAAVPPEVPLLPRFVPTQPSYPYGPVSGAPSIPSYYAGRPDPSDDPDADDADCGGRDGEDAEE